MTIQPQQIAPQRLDLPREPWSLRDVSVIDINLTDLDHNMQALRRMVGEGCALCPIIKADAYGLGAARIGKRLAFNGAEMLAVYTPDQAGELLRSAVGCRILVLMPVREIARVDEIYRGLIADKVDLVVHDLDHVTDLLAITERYGLTIRVHLEIDTGMSRGGCSVTDAPAVLEKIASTRRFKLAGVFTHFARAEADDDFTGRQMAAFERLLREQARHIPRDCRIHVANTFATIRHAQYHKNMARVGLAWAGYGSECMRGGEIIPEAHDLRPIVTWKSRLVQVRTIESGSPVGYGSRWTAKRRTTLGLVPVGYADGYPTTLGGFDGPVSGAPVAVFERAANGAPDEHGDLLGYAPVVGAVNMDQITIDLTDVIGRHGGGGARGASSVGVGTIVELVSANVKAPNHLPTLAHMAGTIPHELLTRLNPRIRRMYLAPVHGGEHVEVHANLRTRQRIPA